MLREPRDRGRQRRRPDSLFEGRALARSLERQRQERKGLPGRGPPEEGRAGERVRLSWAGCSGDGGWVAHVFPPPGVFLLWQEGLPSQEASNRGWGDLFCLRSTPAAPRPRLVLFLGSTQTTHPLSLTPGTAWFPISRNGPIQLGWKPWDDGRWGSIIKNLFHKYKQTHGQR